MSLCRSNRFYSISISFLFILFLFNSHCKSPAALLLHSVFKTAYAAHYGDKSTKNILLPQIFPHLFIQQIKKEKHFSSFPFLKTAISLQIIWSFLTYITGFTMSNLRPSASIMRRNSPTPGSISPCSIFDIYDLLVPTSLASSLCVILASFLASARI